MHASFIVCAPRVLLTAKIVGKLAYIGNYAVHARLDAHSKKILGGSISNSDGIERCHTKGGFFYMVSPQEAEYRAQYPRGEIP